MSEADEQSNVGDDEDEDTRSHRCSMVKRYNIPTFFSGVTDKRAVMTPAKNQAYQSSRIGESLISGEQRQAPATE
jgi:hypothetical protein